MNLTLTRSSQPTVTGVDSYRITPLSGDLRPERYAQAEADAKTRRLLAGIAAVVAVLIAALWFVKTSAISDANTRLDTANTAQVEANATLVKLAPVAHYYDTLKANTKAVQTQMAQEILGSNLLKTYKDVAGKDVGLVKLSIVIGDTSQCPSPDPFNTVPLVGCLTLEGTAADRPTVATFLKSLFASASYAVPFNSGSNSKPVDGCDKRCGVDFTASAGLTAEVLSKRYSDVKFLFPDVTKALEVQK